MFHSLWKGASILSSLLSNWSIEVMMWSNVINITKCDIMDWFLGVGQIVFLSHEVDESIASNNRAKTTKKILPRGTTTYKHQEKTCSIEEMNWSPLTPPITYTRLITCSVLATYEHCLCCRSRHHLFVLSLCFFVSVFDFCVPHPNYPLLCVQVIELSRGKDLENLFLQQILQISPHPSLPDPQWQVPLCCALKLNVETSMIPPTLYHGGSKGPVSSLRTRECMTCRE